MEKTNYSLSPIKDLTYEEYLSNRNLFNIDHFIPYTMCNSNTINYLNNLKYKNKSSNSKPPCIREGL